MNPASGSKFRRPAAVILGIWLSFLILFLLVYYPSVGNSFDYAHMAISIESDQKGAVDQGTMNIGYYIYTIMLSKISGISYDFIPFYFMSFFLFSLVFVLILDRISGRRNRLVVFLIAFVYLFKFGNVDAVAWWSHGIGFGFALLILYFATRKMHRSTATTQVILILMLVALNTISYKMTMFAIAGLVGLEICRHIMNRKKPSHHPIPSQGIAIGFSLVYVLAFNQMFYSQFMPRIVTSTDVTASGFDKLLIPFVGSANNALSTYWFSTPESLFAANTIWTFLSILPLVIWGVYFARRLFTNSRFESQDYVFAAIVIASSVIFLLYSTLGAPEITIIVFSGLISYSLLVDKAGKRVRNVILATLIVMIALDGIILEKSNELDLMSGVRDHSNYDYLEPSAEFYAQYFVAMEDPSTPGSTDVFTHGYLAKQLAVYGIPFSSSPTVFTTDEMSTLLNLEHEHPNPLPSVYILNLKLTRFYAQNWITYNAWTAYSDALVSNPEFTCIYDSGDVSMLCPM